MPPELLFFLAGVIGSACRAAISSTQATFSRQSAVDLVIGGATGVILPLIAQVVAPEQAKVWLQFSPMAQAAAIIIVSYAGASVIQNLIVNRIASVAAALGVAPPPPAADRK